MLTVIEDNGDVLTLSNGLIVLREDVRFYLDTEEQKQDEDNPLD